MRSSPFWWIFILFMVLLDLYVFQALKVLTASTGIRTRTIIHVVYWVLSVSAVGTLLLLPYLHFDQATKVIRSTIFALIIGLFFAKLIGAVFFLVDDIRRGAQWVAFKTFLTGSTANSGSGGDAIPRSAFLSWMGMIAGGGLYGSLVYGFGNKYRYDLKKIPLAFSNLPAAFKGLRIVHISDIHSGSFTDKEAVNRGVQKILEQKPDLILFTGDLVNDRADEMEHYKEVFSQLRAPLGVFSTLGNHDYGDYARWESPEAKAANLERLKNVHAEMGWKLLMDEHHVIEKDGHSLSLLGVQNISGRGNFHSYGDLSKAYAGAQPHPFKILMSHDPSHWDAEVVKSYPDIDLMLSGHTHGMQFGVEIPGWRWSPVQYFYKQWAGLYETGSQKLYVNRGFGFIGYPGRVGILPEITLIELI